MLKEIGSVLSFLTILPMNNANLETIAKYMYIFPIAGIAIGLIVGIFGFGLSEIGLEPLIVGLLVVAVTAVLTGIHHTDGLADFADGLMVKGTKIKKLEAMKDVSTGSSGIVAIVLYFIGMIIALSQTNGFELFKIIVIAEIIAKFSMVLMASIGQSAALGSNSPFVSLMKDKKKLVTAASIALIPIIFLGAIPGLILFCASIGLTLFLIGLSSKSFGGITGDVLGATNELTRLASVLIFVSI
jgi:adenosylcobinamide-GDP ribazoletransferase